jgi:ribosome-binding protein aMBF1 (putative translation factor)
LLLGIYQKDPVHAAKRTGDCTAKSEGGIEFMKRTLVKDLHTKWMKKADYRAEYEGLEEEFSLIGALIEVRSRAGLTQAQLAERMKTTQAVVARLESGKFKPSTRTLERVAHATGTKLQIRFVSPPQEGAQPVRGRRG